jgi:hypothetical protein
VQAIRRRKAGLSYELIAQQTGLSRTGVFHICARHEAGRWALAGRSVPSRKPRSGG